MKRIKNEMVRIPPHLQKAASEAHIAVVDTAGMFVTTAQFLCGENPWGLHQDYHFSSPFSEVRRGARIVRTAEAAIDNDDDYIVISNEDHATLLKVLADPKPSAATPMPPELARIVLPLIETIELPEDTVLTKEKKETAA